MLGESRTLFSFHCLIVDFRSLRRNGFIKMGQHSMENNPVNLYVGTSEKDVCLFYDVFCGKKRIHSERMTLSDEIRPFSYVYKPEYGDGITVNFAFMRKGVFYSKQVKITRPCPEEGTQTAMENVS